MFSWLRSLFPELPKRAARYSDFVHISRAGAVTVDLAGWFATTEGRERLKQQLAEMKAFEKFCRERSPDGSFSFYD